MMMSSDEDDGDEAENDVEMPVPCDTSLPQPTTSRFRPVLKSTRYDDIAPGVAARIKESMEETNERAKVKRKREPAPPTVHFAITGNEREEKEEKERQLAERKRVREEKKRMKEKKRVKKKTTSPPRPVQESTGGALAAAIAVPTHAPAPASVPTSRPRSRTRTSTA